MYIQSERIKKVLLVCTLLLMVTTIGVILYFGPEQIIRSLGIQNSYLFILIFSILDGVSFLTSASFFTILVLVSKNLEIWTLILLVSIGLTIGDSFYYILGKNIKSLSKYEGYNRSVEKVRSWLEKVPHKWRFLFIFLYTSVSPFPKDILSLVLGAIDYPYVKTILPMLLGNALFVWLVLKASSFLI